MSSIYPADPNIVFNKPTSIEQEIENLTIKEQTVRNTIRPLFDENSSPFKQAKNPTQKGLLSNNKSPISVDEQSSSTTPTTDAKIKKLIFREGHVDPINLLENEDKLPLHTEFKTIKNSWPYRGGGENRTGHKEREALRES